MKEIWKEIKGYPNYMVSNMGQVKSLNYNHTGREKIMKPSVNKSGYLLICLSKNSYIKNYYLHRLVAEAFIPNPNNLPQVNHKNEIKDDNKVENLEWCDQKYNNNYNGRQKRIAAKRKKITLQINPNTNEIIKEFPSTIEVKRQLGLTHISDCCKGKRKTCGGFKWEFKKEDS